MLENDSFTPSSNGELTDSNQTDTRFKAGNTFGKGRPVGSKNKGQLALEAIGQEHAEAILQKLIQQALKGDTNAAKFVLERCWPLRKGARIPFNFPPVNTVHDLNIAFSSVLEEINQGSISIEEGDLLTKILNHKRDVIMMRDLKIKIDSL